MLSSEWQDEEPGMPTLTTPIQHSAGYFSKWSQFKKKKWWKHQLEKMKQNFLYCEHVGCIEEAKGSQNTTKQTNKNT